jgi:DNA polymerase
MIISGDFETTFTKEYSLSKLSEVEYILDPRFQAIMLSLKFGDRPSQVHIGEAAIAKALAEIDWANVAWLSHNTRFDGAILAWRFGHVPKMYLDTLSMARATTHWYLGSSSLRRVSDCLGLPPKGNEVENAIGKRLEDFTPAELDRYAMYCMRDNDNCREIFDQLRAYFCGEELRLIDLVMRMFILPQIQLDTEILKDHHAHVVREKQKLLAYVETIDPIRFSSNQQFKQLLEEYGVEVPMKTSPTTGEAIPALARGDWQFKELLADQSQPHEVQAILAARVAVKSTLEETRSFKLWELSKTDWPRQGRGWAPVPLKYYGARPGRLAGDGGMNWQNIMRGSPIRKAIKAPPGMRIIHRDASQIEARMVAWLAVCIPLVEAFAARRDVYCEFASIVYQRPITPKDVKERFVGKTCILGLGYGCGPPRFRHMLFIGNGGISVAIEPEEAQRIVYSYRSNYPEIPDLWGQAQTLLRLMAENDRADPKTLERLLFGRAKLTPLEAMLQLPNRMKIYYPELHWQDDQMVYKSAHGAWRKIYGAKAIENICQALARIVVTDAAVRVYEETGYYPFLTTHDSLDYCVPLDEAEAMDAELERQFALVPTWAQGLPLASEGGWGATLHDAEQKVNA